jgi:hypothetical protein
MGRAVQEELTMFDLARQCAAAIVNSGTVKAVSDMALGATVAVATAAASTAAPELPAPPGGLFSPEGVAVIVAAIALARAVFEWLSNRQRKR